MSVLMQPREQGEFGGGEVIKRAMFSRLPASWAITIGNSDHEIFGVWGIYKHIHTIDIP